MTVCGIHEKFASKFEEIEKDCVLIVIEKRWTSENVTIVTMSTNLSLFNGVRLYI